MIKVGNAELVEDRMRNPCATLEELAKPFGATRQALSLRLQELGLPTRNARFKLSAIKKVCPRCGGLKGYGSKYCFKCHYELHWVPVACDICGGITYLPQSYLLFRIRKGQKHFYCNRGCKGLGAGIYGYISKRNRNKGGENGR